MVLKKFVEDPIRKGQTVKIVFAPQNEIVKLRQVVNQPGLDVETSKIKVVVMVVVEELLPDIRKSVKRVDDTRLVINRGHRRSDDVVFFCAISQRHIRGIKNR